MNTSVAAGERKVCNVTSTPNCLQLPSSHDKNIIFQEVLGRTNDLFSFHYLWNIVCDTDLVENTASNREEWRLLGCYAVWLL
jgi:hypothetical protein